MREAKRKAQPAPRDGTASVDAVGLEERLRHTRKQLLDVEKQIYNLETQYLENANVQGNALRGVTPDQCYEGLLSSSTMNAKKAQLKAEDRIFSGSSVSGPMQPPSTRAEQQPVCQAAPQEGCLRSAIDTAKGVAE
ncbi:uncharacterized protein HaLaN_00721, partial [Haematococcus lacustris]